MAEREGGKEVASKEKGTKQGRKEGRKEGKKNGRGKNRRRGASIKGEKEQRGEIEQNL